MVPGRLDSLTVTGPLDSFGKVGELITLVFHSQKYHGPFPMMLSRGYIASATTGRGKRSLVIWNGYQHIYQTGLYQTHSGPWLQERC